MRREMRMLRKIIVFTAVFLIFTSLIVFCPVVTQWDRSVIIFLQDKLGFLSIQIFKLPDCILYSIMIALPLIGFGVYFVTKKLYKDAVFLCSVPLVTYILNYILKHIMCRPRPPFELQIAGIHPDSYSYVSTHSLVTFCLWGMVIWYLYKYCNNKLWRFIGISISVLWILFVGLSRVMTGVHNPTDVLGAYLLGIVLLICFLDLRNYLIKTS